MRNKPTEPEAITYGARLRAGELVRFLEQAFEVNRRAETRQQPKTPVCIWGAHGVGKTQLVESFARERGYAFAFLSPAQFEEMGDLHGMPQIEAGKTVFRPPSWAPDAPGPGILLIDDFNRADDRILRGIMPLLQQYGLLSWQLPPQWQIVLTANPDSGDYSVTPLDPAMLTRMMHATFVFDPVEWARWAQSAGVHPTGIRFVLSQPELITGFRTTARTLTQFFQAFAELPEPRKQLELVHSLGAACLDETTVAAFIQFLQTGADLLPDAAALLQATDFDHQIRTPLRKVSQGRVEVLAGVVRGLLLHLQTHGLGKDPLRRQNLKLLLLLDFLPADLRFALLRDLAALPDPQLQALLSDPEIGQAPW